MLGLGHRVECFAVIVFAMVGSALMATALPAAEPSVEEMKARVSEVGIGDRPRLCVQIAERQLAEADKLYTAADVDQAQTKLTDVIAYSEMARDYALQSRKYQKQTEIAVRGMTRKLTEVMHTLTQEDQAPVRAAVSRLDRVRDDLLAAMFKKGAK
jgi:hypothetical protein